MARPFDRRNSSPYNPKKLVGQYFAQRIPEERQPVMAGCYAITFRPGGYTSSFADRAILPAGAATLFQLGYEMKACQDGKARLRIPLLGMRAQCHPDGGVVYDADDCCLRMDLSRRPRTGVGGQVFDPERNPSLLELALLMDRACQRAINGPWRLQQYPHLPRVLLGFPVDRVPEYQDTPALRELAARRAGMPVRRLGNNGELLLDRLLRDTWEESLITPNDPGNRTGTVLLDAQLCPRPSGFLRVYEDFREMLGVPTWNPARKVAVQQVTNPAYSVLEGAGLGSRPDFNQVIAPEVIQGMLSMMREHLGDQAGVFSDEDLLDGITSPVHPLVPWSSELPKLRARLPVFANECCTDEDLKAAVRDTSQPLWLRHACRIQVLHVQQTATNAESAFAGSQLSGQCSVQCLEELQLAS